MVKKFGEEVAKKLPRRIKELKAFESLNEVPSSPPFRRHKLEGALSEYFAINITYQYRLIICPDGDDIVIEDLKTIKNVEIVEVSKHYEK